MSMKLRRCFWGSTLLAMHVVLSKIGRIKMVYHRPINGKIKTCTLQRSSTGKWYMYFSVECEPERLPENAESVGLPEEAPHL
ncbi:MAG TPA: hypothetical protein VKR42_14530 [Ktedonobacteraceae bacterium]|nr:hypothetical protein [Ktedonobacteraceae bacterium]